MNGVEIAPQQHQQGRAADGQHIGGARPEIGGNGAAALPVVTQAANGLHEDGAQIAHGGQRPGDGKRQADEQSGKGGQGHGFLRLG